MTALPSGDLVKLRALTADDQQFVDRLKARPSEFTAYELSKQRSIAEKLAEGPLIDEHGGDAMVLRCSDDQPIGLVDWLAIYYGPKRAPFNRLWTLGRELAPEVRGQGYGTDLLCLMIDWLFTTTDAYRIEMHGELENVASRRSVERVGFIVEGVLRGAVYRAGAYRDLAMYGLIRPQWKGYRWPHG